MILNCPIGVNVSATGFLSLCVCTATDQGSAQGVPTSRPVTAGIGFSPAVTLKIG